MELFKQEMELYLLFCDFRLKNFFYKMFLGFNNDTKNGFENRKCRKGEYPMPGESNTDGVVYVGLAQNFR